MTVPPYSYQGLYLILLQLRQSIIDSGTDAIALIEIDGPFSSRGIYLLLENINLMVEASVGSTLAPSETSFSTGGIVAQFDRLRKLMIVSGYTAIRSEDNFYLKNFEGLLIQLTEITEMVNPVSSSDPDESAVIEAILVDGSLTDTQADAVRTRIQAFKAQSKWADLVCYYGYAGGTPASHAVNWKNPGTNNLVYHPSSTSTHNSSGFTANQSTQGFADTGILPSDLNRNAVSVAYYISVRPGSFPAFHVSMGGANGANEFLEFIISSGNVKQIGLNCASSSTGLAHLSGYSSAIRSASNLTTVRNSANNTATRTTASVAPQSNQTIFIGGLNNGAATAGFPSPETYGSYMIMNSVMTPAEDIANKTAEEDYQTAMGR